MKKFWIISSLILCLWACGREKVPAQYPKDTTPLVLEETVPANYTTHFMDHTITLLFNKMPDLKTLEENVQIWPPLAWKKIKVSGKKAVLILKEVPDSTVTYHLILGEKTADLQENTLSEPFTLVFSAGSKMAAGKLHLRFSMPDTSHVDDEQLAIELFSQQDSLIIFSQRVAVQKYMEIPYLDDGQYRIQTYLDKNGNFRLEEDKEFFANELFELQNGESLQLHLEMAIHDTVPPFLEKMQAETQNRVSFLFDEPIQISRETVLMMESDSLDHTLFGEKAFIYAQNSADEGRKLHIVVDSLRENWFYICRLRNVEDMYGNAIDELERLLEPKFKQDQAAPALREISPQDGSIFREQKAKIHFRFNEPIHFRNSRFTSTFFSLEKEEMLFLRQIDPVTIELYSRDFLQNYQDYFLRWQAEVIDYSGNSSTFEDSLRFTTMFLQTTP